MSLATGCPINVDAQEVDCSSPQLIARLPSVLRRRRLGSRSLRNTNQRGLWPTAVPNIRESSTESVVVLHCFDLFTTRESMLRWGWTYRDVAYATWWNWRGKKWNQHDWTRNTHHATKLRGYCTRLCIYNCSNVFIIAIVRKCFIRIGNSKIVALLGKRSICYFLVDFAGHRWPNYIYQGLKCVSQVFSSTEHYILGEKNIKKLETVTVARKWNIYWDC